MASKTPYEALLTLGWRRLERSNPRMLSDGMGNKYPTFEKEGTRVCVGMSRSLGLYHGFVTIYDSCDPTDMVLWQIVVDKTRRRKGKARAALRDLARVADEHSLRLYLEPTPTDDRSVSRQRLVDFYKSEGYLPVEGDGDKVLTRSPGILGQIKSALAA